MGIPAGSQNRGKLQKAKTLSRQAACGVGIPFRARTGSHASTVSQAGCIQPGFPAAPLSYRCTACGTAALPST